MSKVWLRGTEIAYDDVGSGPAVVLLHGFPFNRSMWREQVEELRQSYRVVVPDLRGHGETSAVAGPATMEAMAQDIAALLEHLSIARTTIGGLSMGGYVALAFYRLFESQVRALVLADTRAQADTEEGKLNRKVQAQKILQEGMGLFTETMLPKLLSVETLKNRPDVVERVRKMMVETKPEGAAAALEGMAQRQDQTSFLSRINAPTLITVGREDAITPVADAELMHRAIGGSRLEIIEAAGHVSNIEQPETFNRALLAFLHAESLRDGSPG